jgi:predicted ATP-grasp superfamily ATP-dependent carboligase
MKKFLILGIGNAQVDLYKKLQGKFEIHGLSNTDQGRGYRYCNYFECINITDLDAVLAYAIKNKIDYIYSIGSDVAMPTVAYVAEKLNLPHFVSYQTATLCNNKALFRRELTSVYGAVPFQVESTPPTNVELPFPIIVKPVDSQGQRGVSTAKNNSEVLTSFNFAKQYSRCGDVILERKIEGVEVSVNAYVKDGELVFFLPSDREAWPQFDGGLIKKHLLPVTLSDLAIVNVERLVKETIQSVGISNGPAYFQIKMENDTPFLIEVTPRFDGCHMWNLIDRSTGVDLLNIAIEHLLTDKVVIENEYNVNAANLEFICQPPEEKVKEYIVINEPEYLEYYYQVGDVVKKMNGKMEKCGFRIDLVK